MLFFICVVSGFALIFGLVSFIVLAQDSPDIAADIWGACLVAAAGAIIGCAAAIPLAGFTGGADCSYGHGVAVGTVISSEFKGTVYKTHEIELRQGHGEARHTLNLSGANLSALVGSRVQLEYDGCWLPDYARGSSSRYVRGWSK